MNLIHHMRVAVTCLRGHQVAHIAGCQWLTQKGKAETTVVGESCNL